MRYESVRDYLLGPMTSVLCFNQKGEADKRVQGRDTAESMHGEDPATDVISAVVCYSMLTRDDLTPRMVCRILPNPYARVRLDAYTMKFLRRCLNGDRAGLRRER